MSVAELVGRLFPFKTRGPRSKGWCRKAAVSWTFANGRELLEPQPRNRRNSANRFGPTDKSSTYARSRRVDFFCAEAFGYMRRVAANTVRRPQVARLEAQATAHRLHASITAREYQSRFTFSAISITKNTSDIGYALPGKLLVCIVAIVLTHCGVTRRRARAKGETCNEETY